MPENSSSNCIAIKQNDATNNIAQNFNDLRNLKKEETNFEEEKIALNTKKGEIKIEATEKEYKKMKSKLKYPNLKKLFIYFKHRIMKENKRTFLLEINQLFKLRGHQRSSKNIQALKEDLDMLEKIKVKDFTAWIEGKQYYLKDSVLFTWNRWEKEKTRQVNYISITAGEWADPLITDNQGAYIPKEIFSFNNLELDISYNILIRCRNQFIKLKKMNEPKFKLKVNSLLKGVDVNARKDGPTKIINNIEQVFDKLESLRWFDWNYKSKTKDNLPGRNKLKAYRDFVVVFSLTSSRLEEAYGFNSFK